MLDRLWEGQQALPYDAEGQVVVVTLTVDDSAGVVAVDGGNGNTGSTPVPLGHGEAPGAGRISRATLHNKLSQHNLQRAAQREDEVHHELEMRRGEYEAHEGEQNTGQELSAGHGGRK